MAGNTGKEHLKNSNGLEEETGSQLQHLTESSDHRQGNKRLLKSGLTFFFFFFLPESGFSQTAAEVEVVAL